VQFPVGADALDRLIENETYLDIFTQCLGDEPAYCNAHLFLRSGPQPRFVTTSRRAGSGAGTDPLYESSPNSVQQIDSGKGT